MDDLKKAKGATVDARSLVYVYKTEARKHWNSQIDELKIANQRQLRDNTRLASKVIPKLEFQVDDSHY